MTSKHTPGPWECRLGMEADGPDGAFVIYGPDTATLTARTPWMSRRDESAANARLMAAAPELLQVAVLVASWLDADSGNAPLQKAKYELAKSLARSAFGSELNAAIAKAEGK